MEKRDALIAEGHAAAARVVSEAEQAQRAQLGCARAGAVAPRAPDRRTAHLRARVPHEAEGLHRGSAARPRDLERADHRRRRSPLAAAAPQPAAVTAAPQRAAVRCSTAAAPAYNGPQSSDYAAYPQPTDYPGFAAATEPTAPDRAPRRGRVSVRALLLLAAVAVAHLRHRSGCQVPDHPEPRRSATWSRCSARSCSCTTSTNSGAAFSLASGFTWILSIVAVGVDRRSS